MPFLCSLIEIKYSPTWPFVLPVSVRSSIPFEFFPDVNSASSMLTVVDGVFRGGVRGKDEDSGDGERSPLVSKASLSQPWPPKRKDFSNVKLVFVKYSCPDYIPWCVPSTLDSMVADTVLSLQPPLEPAQLWINYILIIWMMIK